MQNSSTYIGLTIIISTLLILAIGAVVIFFIFLYQRKKFRHQQELFEIREAFSQTLLQSKLEIQEQTLDHIAKELHANFSHLVSLININLSAILPQSTADMKENIIETKSLAKQLMSELKALSANLNTDHIMRIGFVKALEHELGRLTKTKKYHVTLSKTGDEYRLLPEHEIILFRLCQEVLNNIVKYSQATEVTAVITYTPEEMKLAIADNGIGFDIEKARSQGGEKESTGLFNIQKRASLIKARFDIHSSPGKGTIVEITIPPSHLLKS